MTGKDPCTVNSFRCKFRNAAIANSIQFKFKSLSVLNTEMKEIAKIVFFAVKPTKHHMPNTKAIFNKLRVVRG